MAKVDSGTINIDLLDLTGYEPLGQFMYSVGIFVFCYLTISVSSPCLFQEIQANVLLMFHQPSF